MANHALPQTTDTYANVLTYIDARLDDLSQGLDPAFTNLTAYGSTLIAGSIRWNSLNNYWEKYNGTSWPVLSSAYSININGTVGNTTAADGKFTTLSSSGIASLGASSTVGGVAIVTTTGSQTLTNKILSAPVISTITNTATLTLPNTADTLVGRATTDTLTNKTLVAPKIASTDFIADPAGLAYLKFTQIATAVNSLTVRNAATTGTPAILATGSDTNVSLNLVPQGSGTVQANGVDLVTTTGTQTLTNKTLTAPVISTITNTATLTLPNTADTLVGRATTDTLTNKTLTAPKIVSAGFIADPAGLPYVTFTQVASATNGLTISNAATLGKPSVAATGGDADITLNLIPKGTGTVQISGVDIITTTGTQTLTNKSLSDNTSYFIDETDNTKRLQFQLSGLTTATTVVLTPPTASDTLVGTAASQTLSSKTLSTGSVWNGGVIGVAYGGMGTSTAPTQFGISYASSTSAYASTAAGTSGQFLGANTGAAPTWQSFDLSINSPEIGFKKSVRLATTANLGASTFAGNVLTNYSNTITLAVTTTISSTAASTTSTAGIKVGAVLTGNDANTGVGNTVASIIDATNFTLTSVAAASATGVSTTFTQTIGALTVDGVAVAANDRILVKDQSDLGGLSTTTSPLANGIYTVTNIGSTTVPWVLTRTVDANTSVNIADSMVLVTTGATNGGRTFTTRFLATNTLNTTPMYWDRVVDTSASFALPLPTTARGIDIDVEAKTIRLNTGNLADLAINSFGIRTIQSLAASTYTNAATVYIAGAPAASTNATITNPYALQVAAGNTLLGGNLTVSGGTITAGNVSTALLSGNSTTNITIGTGLTTGTFTVGATGSTGAVSLFPATGSQAITLGGATTGTVQIGSTLATAVQLPTGKTKVGQTFLLQGGAVNITLPTLAGTLVGSGDSGTVSNAMLANSSITIGSTAVSLGGTVTTIAGLTSVTSTGFTGSLTGAASLNVLKAGDTLTGLLAGNNCVGAIAVATQGNPSFEARSASGVATDAAYMTFHRQGLYAVRFGLDTDNVLKVGGWSMGAVAYKLWHEGNDGAGSGLDADTLDGYGTSLTSTSSTVALRDGSGDISVRLIRSEFANEATIAGGIVFRNNNSTDNYMRCCSDAAAIRTFLSVPSTTGGNASGNWGINVTGSAATTPLVSVDNSIAYGRSGLQFINVSGLAGDVASTTNTPTADWWYILRGNHANATGYYTDLALPMTAATNIRYRRIAAGVSSGWITVLDSTNYNSYSPTLTGTGASGSWGISITGSSASCTGNAATATSAGTCSGNAATTSMSSGRTDATAYPVVWGVTGATSQLYSCTAVNIQSSTGTLNATTVAATTVTATETRGAYLGVNNTTNTNGYGLSLYGGGVAGQPTYGIMFQGTGTFGTHGSVTADWATYFTMDSTANRGWIFRNTTSGNVASVNNSGTAVFNGNVTAFSDVRLKTDIEVIDNAVHKVQQLRGVTYTRTDDANLPRQTGVIAQEVLQVLPEAVLGTEETTYSVAYGNMVGLLIEAIKEQQQQIDGLKQLVLQLVGDGK